VDYPVHYFVPSRSVNVIAYLVDSNGMYTDVTSQVHWVSTRPDVVSLRQGVVTIATAMTPGDSEIHASYQMLADTLPLTVRPFEDFQESSLRLQFSAPLFAGRTALAAASLVGPDEGVTEDVTSLAAWASSNSQVLTVHEGRITAHKPGTARITVSYGGYVDDCIVSVQPSNNGALTDTASER
jgi:hypothetical protein